MSEAKRPLAVFDLDRTLLDGRTIHHLAETFDVYEPAEAAWHAYRTGEQTWRETKAEVASLFAGVPMARIEAACRQLPFDPEATRVVGRLKDRGYRVALVTASYEPAAERAQRDLGLDLALGTRLLAEDGIVTGRLGEPRFPPCCGRWICKSGALQMVRRQLETGPTLAVGDGPNDACMLAAADLGIAVDPTRAEAVEAADIVADLAEVPALADEHLGSR